MQIISKALAALLGCVLAAGSSAALAREATGLEGHWLGDLAAKTGEKSSAEISLDHYGCYALSVKRDQGIEAGTYTAENGKLVLKTTGGEVRLVFTFDEGKTRLEQEKRSGETLPEGCCTFTRR